uniref:PAS domain-containing protein n=1 Tax=Plectus sambesii TaxID=2011161 RepID=A0A914V572_9BILA
MLPLADSVKDRLFQLQIMSLACIFIRKQRYLPHILGEPNGVPCPPSPHGRSINRHFDSCKALRGFLIMVTRQGKMLYISENASDYLGHSVEEIMSQGDSIYELVDPRDHTAVQAELLSGPPSVSMNARFPDERVFICRMNLSRTAKRQLQYHKFVLIEGRYLHPAEYYQALLTLTNPAVFIHPVFAGYCQPLINPENAEVLSSGNTSMFRSLHLMDMQFVHLDDIGLFHLGYTSSEDLEGDSWYRLVHPLDLPEISFKHRLLCQEKEGSVICLIRLQHFSGHWLWLHTVLAVRGNFVHQPQDGRRVRHLIHATYQLLSDLEAATLQANSWIYNIRSNYNEFCSKSTSPDEDPDNPPAGGSGPLPLERTVSIPPQMPMPSPIPLGPTKFPHPMALPPQVKCDQSEVFPPVPVRTHPMMMPLPPQPPPPLHNSNNQAIRVEIPCKNGGNLNDFNSHVVVSDIALNINSILTPDHSSPESSASQASIANSTKSHGGQLAELYRPLDKHLPVLETNELDDYLRDMERGSLFESSGASLGQPDSPLAASTAGQNPNLVRLLQQRFGGTAGYCHTELLMRHSDAKNESPPAQPPHQTIQRHHSIQVNYPRPEEEYTQHGGIHGDPFYPHHHHPRMQKRLGSWAGV